VLTAVKFAKTEGGKALPGTEFDVACDVCIVAIGQSKLRTLATSFAGVALDSKGCVLVDSATRRTGNSKVFAGGDCINGGKEVVNAVADGRDAAHAMLRGFMQVGAQ
jgi:dihydropyrimidine dehydrogenase (NAD+) subunit PreT